MAGYVYLRAGHGDDRSLFLVELSLLEGLPSGWFYKTFGSTMVRPTSLGDHHGLPVYGVPTTGPIFGQLLYLLRFPQLLRKARHCVPRSIEKDISKELWKLSLEYFGLMDWDIVDPSSQDDKSEDGGGELLQGPSSKRLKMSPIPPIRLAYLTRIADALAASIKAEHTGWPSFAAGATTIVNCQFINGFDYDYQHLTYSLVLPGEPVVEAVSVAYFLGFEIGDDRSVERGPFEQLLLERLAPAKHVDWSLTRSRTSKAKTRLAIVSWPATNHLAAYPSRKFPLVPLDDVILTIY